MSVQKKCIAITQRVDQESRYPETRDALDRRWSAYLFNTGLLPVLLPNNTDIALELIRQVNVTGVILSGGNDLARYGGDAPERDELDTALLDYACENQLAVLGVCRGMQSIQDYFGINLQKVEGHVADRLAIVRQGETVEVNSYHRWGANSVDAHFDCWARSADDVVKAISHRQLPIHGVMWHPERNPQPDTFDVGLIRRIFGEKK